MEGHRVWSFAWCNGYDVFHSVGNVVKGEILGGE